MICAIRSELVKLRTTNTWWLMGLGIIAFTALALLYNMAEAHFGTLQNREDDIAKYTPEEKQAGAVAEERARYAEAHTAAGLAKIAASIYTSGQFFGVMLIMVMGAIIVTNEYFHQTATSTFLTIPHRTKVILAKFVSAIVFAVGAWALTTAINIPAGAVFLSTEHVTNSIGSWDVTRSLLLNLAAYAVWAVLGVGLGVLIRSQIGAVVTGTAAYLVGMVAASLVFQLVYNYLIKEDWVHTAQVAVPAVASMVMVTPGEMYPHAPAQWVGAAVLIGYGLVFGLIGTLITRKRDIS